MKLSSLLSIVILHASLAHARVQEPLTQEAAKSIREMYGILDLGTEGDAEAFSFRQNGKFLVSHQTFASQPEAQAYCVAKSGYQLTQGLIPGVITMMGLPFVNLREQMIVKTRSIPESRSGTGVIAWVRVDLTKIPQGHKLSEQEQKTFDQIRSGDFVLAWVDGAGGSDDGYKSVSAINAALTAAGKSSVAMSAICVEDKLEKDWR